MKKKIKSNNAITLIALIITLLILLILVGVTLNMIMGESGIIKKAQIAVEKNNKAQDDEIEKLEQYDKFLNSIRENEENTNNVELQSLKVIKCKTPPSLRNATKICDYPSGFNPDNCTILSFKFPYATSEYYESPSDNYVYTKPDGIYMYMNSTGQNIDLYITVYKFQ